MATETVSVRGKPAHTPGTTLVSYTPDGRHLITAGSDTSIRVFSHGDTCEPATLDDAADTHTALVSANEFFAVAAEDGTVSKYDLETGEMEKLLVRCPFPVRDMSLSRDGEWIAVASVELLVRVVNVRDMTVIQYLREQTHPAKHVSFDPTGRYISVSCTDGSICMYSFIESEAKFAKRFDGMVRRLQPNSELTSRVCWHPNARAFAIVDITKEIVVISTSDWTQQKVFSGGHNGDITAIGWSPNGALFTSAGTDGQIVLWETATQSIVKRYLIPSVINFAWHPTDNFFAFVTSDGELFVYNGFVPAAKVSCLDTALVHVPLLTDTITPHDEHADTVSGRKAHLGLSDPFDDILGSVGMGGDEDDFVGDEVVGTHIQTRGRKRPGEGDIRAETSRKRLGPFWESGRHRSFQSGSTPWRGDRRYLCLNLVGSVWTVKQNEELGAHNTVTVEFCDQERFRDFHFTDPFFYDKACLNEKGTLFSCQPPQEGPATLYYRPHETWTVRTDWRIVLPRGESIKAIALCDSFIFVSTSADYVRVYTLFGIPYRLHRQKSECVTCTAWRDYVMTVGNGHIGGNGSAKLTYSIENVREGKMCQNEDVLALTGGAELKGLMFSDDGDPYIYDTIGVLLVLQHWRIPGQARWVPVLDTRLLDRVSSGRNEETYWPVAVSQKAFHCVILKGGDEYPYFPRPLLSVFDFRMPISSLPLASGEYGEEPAVTSARMARDKLEESFVRKSLLASLVENRIAASEMPGFETGAHERIQAEINKVLLQLLVIECREGEERGMKALELVSMIRDQSGRMLEVAQKVAVKYNRILLEEKIRELAEGRILSDDEDESDAGVD